MNADVLRAIAKELVDLVLAEDTVYLDSLPELVESSLVTPLVFLAGVLDEPGTLAELVAAGRLVRQSAPLTECPAEVRDLILRLPE